MPSGEASAARTGSGSHGVSPYVPLPTLLRPRRARSVSSIALNLVARAPGLIAAVFRLRSGWGDVIESRPELGLIEKQTDENDRRSSHLFLTANGKDAVKNYKAYLKQREAYFAEALTPEELDTLQTLLKKMLAHQSKSGVWESRS